MTEQAAGEYSLGKESVSLPRFLPRSHAGYPDPICQVEEDRVLRNDFADLPLDAREEGHHD